MACLPSQTWIVPSSIDSFLFLTLSSLTCPSSLSSPTSKTDPKSSGSLTPPHDHRNPGLHSLLPAVLATDLSHCLCSLPPTKQAEQPFTNVEQMTLFPAPKLPMASQHSSRGKALASHHIWRGAWLLITHLNSSQG